MSARLALVIANTEYNDPGLAQLNAPGKDAEDFARVLKDQNLCAFDEVNILVDENATLAREAIDEFFARKRPDDLLVLYFSGHGLRDEYGSLYLAVKNTNRDRLRSTAINSSFIREGMDQSRSRRQVLILDCCNSGAFAHGTKAETGGSIGTATAFEGTGYGRVVLTASDTTQFAWEGDRVIGETQNSLFTHFLVKGLEGDADRDGDGRITIDELYDFAYEQIVTITPKQTPGKWSYKQQGEIVLRQNMRVEDMSPVALPEDLLGAINSSLPFVREGAVRQLEDLLRGRNLSLARSARHALEKIAEEDDSRRVSNLATQVLEPIRQSEQLALQKAEEDRLAAERARLEIAAREEAERVAKLKAEEEEEERIAKARLKEEHLAKEFVEAEQTAARPEAQRERKELASPLAREEATPTHGSTALPQPALRRLLLKNWVIIGIIGVIVIGTGALLIPFITNLLSPPAPTGFPNDINTEGIVSDAIDCMGSQSGDEISMLYQWSGVEEVALNQVLQPLVDACGIVIESESTRDQALLDARVQAGAPPDVAFWQVAQLVQYRDQLKTMDSLGADRTNYSDFFLDRMTVDGRWLGLPVKADVKSIIWYSPSNFEAHGYNVPKTWEELNALVETMAIDGLTPWSMGFESGDATGWTGTDFIQDIMLVQQGPEFVLGIIDGSIPYDHPGVRQAYETYGKWAMDPRYTVAGAEGTLSIPFLEAIYMPFYESPEAMMVKQAGFTGAEVARQFPNLQQGINYDFFVFPGIQGVQGNVEPMMAFSEKPAVRALVAYLSSAQGGANWAKATFGVSPNRAAAGNYTDPTLQRLGDAIITIPGFTPDIGDTIPDGFGFSEFQAVAEFVSGADFNTLLAQLASLQEQALR